jgi:hypothetical protein
MLFPSSNVGTFRLGGYQAWWWWNLVYARSMSQTLLFECESASVPLGKKLAMRAMLARQLLVLRTAVTTCAMEKATIVALIADRTVVVVVPRYWFVHTEREVGVFCAETGEVVRKELPATGSVSRSGIFSGKSEILAFQRRWKRLRAGECEVGREFVLTQRT